MTRAAAGLMTIAAALAATLASLPAAADDYRIGVIHIERILRDSPPARTALERIEQQFKARDAELAGRETTLRNDVAQYEKDKPKLDADGRGARERDLVRQRQQFAEDVRARQFEELDKLKERLDQVLTRLAHDRGYDLILQNALWVAKSVDITDEVIKALGP